MSVCKPVGGSNTHLTAHCLLVLLAARVPALVRFDAEAGPAPGTGHLTGGGGRLLLILEQLHQQVELETAARLPLAKKKKKSTRGDAG